MGPPAVRRTPKLAPAFALVLVLLAGGPEARADYNDLRLINLCDVSGGQNCAWVVHSGQESRVDLNTDAGATSRFRSLMSELGVAIAPRLQTPADTLGVAGFQFSAEVGMTRISHDQAFWNGVEGVAFGHRADAWLTTLGAFVRKDLFIPALEWGVGAVNIVHSGMWAIQGTLKVALHEGFHQSPLPSVAVRAGFSRLVGTDQVDLTVGSLDAIISKAFGVSGTLRIEPFAGWNLLFIDARSGVIDATPGCDAAVLQRTNPTDARATSQLPSSCDPTQAGTWGDLGANFTFPRQDIIVRTRLYGGVKLKLSMLFLVAQVAVSPAGTSADSRTASNPGRDQSGTQEAISVSGGLDF